MDSNIWKGITLVLCSNLIAAFSQILLKKAAGTKYPTWWQSYVNPKVITAYTLFFLTTVFGVLAMRFIPLSLSAAMSASGQIFVPVLSIWLLREKISVRRCLGMLIIVLGIVIFSI